MVGRAGVCDRPSILLYSALLMGFHPLPRVYLPPLNAYNSSRGPDSTKGGAEGVRCGHCWLVGRSLLRPVKIVCFSLFDRFEQRTIQTGAPAYSVTVMRLERLAELRCFCDRGGWWDSLDERHDEWSSLYLVSFPPLQPLGKNTMKQLPPL